MSNQMNIVSLKKVENNEEYLNLNLSELSQEEQEIALQILNIFNSKNIIICRANKTLKVCQDLLLCSTVNLYEAK
jgi:hypothetical protein